MVAEDAARLHSVQRASLVIDAEVARPQQAGPGPRQNIIRDVCVFILVMELAEVQYLLSL